MIHARKLIIVTGVLGLIGCAPSTRPSGELPTVTLDTTHVTLYDTGLAQFERQADIAGAARLTIKTTTAHLDDLVSSLIVATDKEVRVTGVEYESTQNLVQAVAASGFAKAMISEEKGYEKPSDLAGYARALVGTEVVVMTEEGELRGTVLDCVAKRAGSTGNDASDESSHDDNAGAKNGRAGDDAESLVLVDDRGALNMMDLARVARISPTSSREASALKNFAAQLGESGGYTETEVDLETAPGSSGRLAVSYIRQAPLWRTLYRLTVKDKELVLEAWAVVHNDTPEDWRDVSMTLVSGLPASYVMSTASPRYMHRESLALDDEEAVLMPQLGSETPDSILFPSELVARDDMSSFGYGGGGGSGSGYGQGAGGLSGRRAKAPRLSGERASSLIDVGAPAAAVQAEAEVAGEISTYKALTPVTIRSGASAMVPVLRKALVGEAFVRIEPGTDPLTCVRAVNTTGLVLQRGAASVFSGGRFRGQSEIGRTEPEETSIWCFGEDPDVTFDEEEESRWEHKALEWKDRQLMAHGIKTTERRYTIDNKAGQPRRLALMMSRNRNGRFLTKETPLEGEYDTSFLFILDVARRSEAEKTIVKEEGIMRSVRLDEASLTELIEEARVSVAQRKILRDALEKQQKIVEHQKEIEVCQDKIRKLEESIEQLRMNLKSVPKLEGAAATADGILKEIMSKEKSITREKETIEKHGAEVSTLVEAQKEILAAVGTPDKTAVAK